MPTEHFPTCQQSSYRAVFLSPHLDDAAFSAGGRIAQLTAEGHVLGINIFTFRPPEIKSYVNALDRERATEEQASAKLLNYESVNLNEPDAFARDKDYVNPSHLFGDFLTSDFEYFHQFADRLEAFLSRIKFDALFIPLGIGWHVDHRMVFYATRRWWYDDQTFFYEDVPYSLITHAAAYRLREIGYVDGTLASAGGSWPEAFRAGYALSRMELIRKYRIPVRWVVEIVFGIFWARHMVRHRERWQWQNWGGPALVPHLADISNTFTLKTEAAFQYASQIEQFFANRKSWWAHHMAYGTKNVTERFWQMRYGRQEAKTKTSQITIAMITDDFLPANTGAGVHVQKVCQSLAQQGFKIIILTTRHRGQKRVETWNGIKVYRFFSLNIYGFSQAVTSRAEVRDILIENSVDIIHIHYLSLMALQVLAEAKYLRVRIIYTAHMSITLLFQPVFMKPLRALVTKLYLRFCERLHDIICVSTAQARYIEQFNIRSRVYVISNPVDFTGEEAPAQPEPRDFVVLFVGRLSPEKNVNYLLEAFAIFRKNRPQAMLCIAGTGREEERLRKQAISLGIKEAVDFKGHVPHENLPPLYAKASVFVLPSLSETQGLVALEAMCFKCPVTVTNRIISAKELVSENENGFIVDPDNPRSLADRLIQLYENPDLRKRMGEESFKRSRSVTSEGVALQLKQIYMSGTDDRSEDQITQNQYRLDRRNICILCGIGRFEDSAGNLSLPSFARSYQNEYFALWRCSACLSIHSLPKLPLAEYYQESPYKKMKVSPFVYRGFMNLNSIIARLGVRKDSKILFCAEYSHLLVKFFKDLAYTNVYGLSEIITPRQEPSRILYDAVFLDDYLERSDDPAIVLEWLSKSLRHGGLLIINTNNAQEIDLTTAKAHLFSQPYRIHLFTPSTLENLARTRSLKLKRLWHKHFLDTLWPFCNYTCMNSVPAFIDNSEDSAFEFKPIQVLRKPWLLPWLLCLGFFGGIFPAKSFMIAVFEKEQGTAEPKSEKS